MCLDISKTIPPNLQISSSFFPPLACSYLLPFSSCTWIELDSKSKFLFDYKDFYSNSLHFLNLDNMLQFWVIILLYFLQILPVILGLWKLL